MNIGTVRTLVLGLIVLVLTGCASSSVLIGSTRPPISEDQVKVYLEPPAGYETVALLEASNLGANGFSAQSRMNKFMNRLKAEAAEPGANGILLQGIETQYAGSANSGYAAANSYGNPAYATGMGYSAAQFSKVGRAIAIYVPVNGTAALVAPASAPDVLAPTAQHPTSTAAPAVAPISSD
ncbi:MAG: hypothetical protein ACRER3_00235 [Pseudomonas fluorescens]